MLTQQTDTGRSQAAHVLASTLCVAPMSVGRTRDLLLNKRTHHE